MQFGKFPPAIVIAEQCISIRRFAPMYVFISTESELHRCSIRLDGGDDAWPCRHGMDFLYACACKEEERNEVSLEKRHEIQEKWV